MSHHDPMKLPILDPTDPASLDDLLTEDEKEIRGAVRQMLDATVEPHITDWFENGSIPDIRALTKDLGSLGVLGMHLEGYGCAGMSATEYGIACLEIEATDSGLRSLVSVQGSLAMFAIWRWGSEEQKQEWLPRMAAGELIGCFGLTEPDAGSDPGSLTTRARRDGDDWILDGRKLWISNAPYADVAIVWAQTDEGIRGFVVPTDVPGVSAPEIKHKMSLRASATGELVLDNVRLPAAAVFPEVRGLKGPLACLNEARYGIVWGSLGAARSSLESARRYATERVQFGKPIGEFQLVQAMLADSRTEAYAGRTMVADAARRFDAGEDIVTEAACCKLFCTEMAGRVADRAVQIFGGAGYMAEYPIERFYRDVRLLRIYEGTSQIQQIVIARKMLRAAANR